jgi:7-carboxy-7-deazaguanine synthase
MNGVGVVASARLANFAKTGTKNLRKPFDIFKMDKIDEKYFISEQFTSIQGEGNFAGVNSMFIRFHFCNLTCTWCDTKYTWLGDHKESKQLTANNIKEIILQSTCSHIIFTGGEPALYRLDKLAVTGKKYHVETNGTIIPTDPLEISLKNVNLSREGMDYNIIKDYNWVVSPKLSNARQQINEPALKYWVDKEFCIFKFIVRNLSDIEEVDQVRQTFGIDKNKIYIGIEGKTLESQLQPNLVDEIIRSGFHFSPRLHIMLWGAKRGK